MSIFRARTVWKGGLSFLIKPLSFGFKVYSETLMILVTHKTSRSWTEWTSWSQKLVNFIINSPICNSIILVPITTCLFGTTNPLNYQGHGPIRKKPVFQDLDEIYHNAQYLNKLFRKKAVKWSKKFTTNLRKFTAQSWIWFRYLRYRINYTARVLTVSWAYFLLF